MINPNFIHPWHEIRVNGLDVITGAWMYISILDDHLIQGDQFGVGPTPIYPICNDGPTYPLAVGSPQFTVS